MKKIMLSALFLAFGTTAICAATENISNIEEISIIQDDKTPIKLEELPEAVKITLSGEDYANWLPSEAFIVTPEEGDKHFEIVLKQEDEMKVVKLDENGKEIVVPAPIIE